ncbi:MAG: copper amine oxidase N-terminal domain-containing protein [Cellulosilyticaceae bacterium]
MNKKYVALGLALGMSCMSFSVMAQETEVVAVPISAPVEKEEGVGSIHQINMEAPITRAEFIIAVMGMTGDKLPQIMDTHYALPAMDRAAELGIIDLEKYPQETWSEVMTAEEKSEVLTKAMQNNGIDIGEVYTTLSQILLDKVTVNGEEVDLGGLPLSHYKGNVMVPLRPVAKAMGFEVTWDQPTYTATLNNGKIKSDVQVGFDSYCYTSVNAIGMSAPFSAGAAPRLVDGVMYVPAAYFDMFGDIEASDATLKITVAE